MTIEPLIVPVNFVCPDEKVWPELRQPDLAPIDPQRLSNLSGGQLNSWVVRTYYELRVRSHPVRLSPRPDPASINVVASRDFGRRDRDTKSFVVIPRGDSHAPMLADFVIHQNGLRPRTSRSAALPHWPQPGIIKRDPGRPPRISRLTFKGRPANLDAEFRSQSFRDRLSAMNIDFEIDTIETLVGDHSWNDYRDADAVLAVRNMTKYDAAKKPASKLINAWIAGVVPLLGPEPAFQELRRSPLDFIEVRTPEDVLNTISSLNEAPGDVRAIMENGAMRAREFDEESISAQWVSLLNGPVARRWQGWKSGGRGARAALVGLQFVAEPLSKSLDRYRLKHGVRILQGAGHA